MIVTKRRLCYCVGRISPRCLYFVRIAITTLRLSACVVLVALRA